MAVVVPSILESVTDLATYKSVTDRYFTRRYVLNANGIENNDIMLLIHSNRIILVSLAPSHFFFKNKIDYTIDFSVGNVDRLCNSVKGKSKKGGQYLGVQSVLCTVEFEDGSSFEVPSCMRGTLIEVNEKLVSNPKLLRKLPDSDGYIAVILSSIELTKIMKNEYLVHEEYVKIKLNAQ